MPKLSRLFRAKTSVIGCFILAACGGGGGGSPPVVHPFTSFSQLPSNGTTQLDGQAVTASYTMAGKDITISNSAGPSAATAQITTENQNLVALSANAPGSSFTVDSRQGGTFVGTSNNYIAGETSNGQMGTAFVNSPATGYEYQTYGAWVTGWNTGSGTIGAGSFGARTKSANMPSGTSASYSGESVGYARRADGQPYSTNSKVSVTTNFSTVNIASDGTKAVNLDSGVTSLTPELDFTGSGSVSGGSFTASISGTGTGPISGRADGVFYGPQANEVGGTFQASGSSGISYMGSFGGS